MKNPCPACGRTESEAMADARALGLQQEFERETYTCCQIGEWAEEQAIAWLEAIYEDGPCADNENVTAEQSDGQPVYVFVRARRVQVPWYKKPD